jgi:hypothetical protein
MLRREERHDPVAWHVVTEVRDQMPEVVLFRFADRAVGEETRRCPAASAACTAW